MTSLFPAVRSSPCLQRCRGPSAASHRECLFPLRSQLAWNSTPSAMHSSRIPKARSGPSLKWDIRPSSSTPHISSGPRRRPSRRASCSMISACAATLLTTTRIISSRRTSTAPVTLNLILGAKYVVLAWSDPKSGADGWKAHCRQTEFRRRDSRALRPQARISQPSGGIYGSVRGSVPSRSSPRTRSLR